MTRQMAGSADEEEAIPDLDFSPRETLWRLIENCIPTAFSMQPKNCDFLARLIFQFSTPN